MPAYYYLAVKYRFLFAAAVLVFLAGAAGAGLVAADFFTGGDWNFLRLPLGGGFSLFDIDLINSMDDIMLDTGNKALKKGVAFFFVGYYGVDLPRSVKTCLLAEMVHFGEVVLP